MHQEIHRSYASLLAEISVGENDSVSPICRRQPFACRPNNIKRSGLTASARRSSGSRACELHPPSLRCGCTKLVRTAVGSDRLDNLCPGHLAWLLPLLERGVRHVELVELILHVLLEQGILGSGQ